jgi:hypothetical protein
VGLVVEALAAAGPAVPVRGVLCFVDADWPLVGGDFAVAGVDVLRPRTLTERLSRGGLLDGPTRQAVHRRLAAAFPPAS